MAINDRDQKLVELLYGLLDEAEATELRAQIAVDAELAERYQKAVATGNLFAEAARFHVAPIQLQIPVGGSELAVKPDWDVLPIAAPIARDSSATASGSSTRVRKSRFHVLVCVASAVAFCLMSGGMLYRSQLRTNAALAKAESGSINLRIVAPGSLQPGVASEALAWVARDDGNPSDFDVRLTLTNGPTSATGLVKVPAATPLPVHLPLPEWKGDPPRTGIRLEVAATDGTTSTRIGAPISAAYPEVAIVGNTDRPSYAPGETVRFRGLTLDRTSVAAVDLPATYSVEGPQGTMPVSAAKLPRGIHAGEWTVPAQSPTGIYRLMGRTTPLGGAANASNPATVAEFEVQRRAEQRLAIDIEYLRDSFDMGEKVVAQVTVKEHGSVAANTRLQAAVIADDGRQQVATTRSAGPGRFQVEWQPAANEAFAATTLAAAAQVDDRQETSGRPVPRTPQEPTIAFHPEGGGIVAGTANRVYFSASGPDKMPVHVAGDVVVSGRSIGKFESERDGLGVVETTLQAGEALAFSLSDRFGKPRLVQAALQKQNATLRARESVVEQGAPLKMEVLSSKFGYEALLTAASGTATVGQQVVDIHSTVSPIQMDLPADVAGVLRVTAYELPKRAAGGSNPIPFAERLVYRKPARRLDVAAVDASDRYSPGDVVRLGFAVANELKRPTPAALGIAVIDESALRPGDARKAAPLASYWLTSAIKAPVALENANFYLSDDPNAARALDLLLGTQGWRRIRPANAADQRTALAGVESIVAMPTTTDNQAEPEPRRQPNRIGNEQSRWGRMLALGGALALYWIAFFGRRINSQSWLSLKPFAARVSYAVVGIVVLVFLTEIAAGYAQRISSVRTVDGRAAKTALDAGRPARGVEVDRTPKIEPRSERADPAPKLRPELRGAGGLVGSVVKGSGGRAGGPALGATPAVVESASNPTSTQKSLPQLPPGPVPISKLQPSNAAHDHLPPPRPAKTANKAPAVAAASTAKEGVLDFKKSINEDHDKAAADSSLTNKKLAESPAKRAEIDRFSFEPIELQQRRSETTRNEASIKLDDPLAKPGLDKLEKDQQLLPRKGLVAPKSLSRGGARQLGARTVRGKEPPLRKQAPTPPGAPASDDAAKNMADPKLIPDPKDVAAEAALPPKPAAPEEAKRALRAEPQRDALDVGQPKNRKLFTREFAYGRRSNVSARVDFPKTIFWNPLLETDETGFAAVQFPLPDSVTRYRVQTFAHAPGRLGVSTDYLIAALPFSVEPAAPPFARPGDRMDLPIRVVNRTRDRLRVRLACRLEGGMRFVDERTSERTIDVDGMATALEFVAVRVEGGGESSIIEVFAAAGAFADAVRKKIAIVSERSMQYERNMSGVLNDASMEQRPTDLQGARIVDCRLAVFPSIVAELKAAALAIEREPGVAEEKRKFAAEIAQAAFQHLVRLEAVDPETVRLAKRHAPTAAAFQNLQQNRPYVGSAAFALDVARSLGASPGRVLAGELGRALEGGQAQQIKDASGRLASLQRADGSIGAHRADEAEGSIEAIEATAAAALAWLQNDDQRDRANRALNWLTRQRQIDGGFGAARATYLAAAALAERERLAPRPAQAGGARLLFDGNAIAELHWAANAPDVVVASPAIAAGLGLAKSIVVQPTGAGSAAYSLQWTAQVPAVPKTPAMAAAAPLPRIAVAQPPAGWKQGAVAAMVVELSNASTTPLVDAVVHMPFPAGLAPLLEDPTALQRAGGLTRLDVRTTDVVAAFAPVPPGKTQRIAFPFRAEIPGTFATGQPTLHLRREPAQAMISGVGRVDIARH